MLNESVVRTSHFVLLSALLLVHAAPLLGASPSRPNIILIYADDLGYGDLGRDLGETTNVASTHPEVVRDLLNRMQAIREDIGDALFNVKGKNERPKATVENPRPLTTFDPDYPYIEPSYLLNQAG